MACPAMDVVLSIDTVGQIISMTVSHRLQTKGRIPNILAALGENFAKLVAGVRIFRFGYFSHVIQSYE